jgi:cell division septum initiation protein DivIVA
MEAAAVRPGEIVRHRFTVGRRGNEPEEVDGFAEGVADQLARLQGEIEWQRARIEHLEQRGTAAQDSAYDRIAREFMEVVRRFDEAATQVRAKAEDEARVALAAARGEANRILETATREAERLLQAARTGAEGVVAEAARQVERVVREVWPDAPIPAPAGHQAVAVPAPAQPELPPEPAFADFEALTLEFEGSTFDLFGDAGS